MRVRTWIGILVVCGLLLGLLGFGWVSSNNGELHEKWTSSTSRSNQLNHHAIGVGPTGNVIVAPIAAKPGTQKLTNTSCTLARLAPTDGSVRWRTTIPPSDCFTHALTRPAIADTDGDNELEVVAVTTEAALVVYDAATGSPEYRAPLSTHGYGQPTIGNVTSDPGREIVASDTDGEVIVVADGRVGWRVRLNKTLDRSYVSVWDSPIVQDVDGDGRPEVAVGTGSGPVVLNASGGEQWSVPSDATWMTAAQVDGDPALELFTAGYKGIRAHDGATGRLEWNRSMSNPKIRVATDADGDGTVELFVGRPGGEIRSMNAATGETEWTTSITSASSDDDVRVPAPVVGDVGGDNRPEVIAVSEEGTVAVLDSASGSELAAYERTVPIRTVPTIADIDDDDREEILVRYGDGRVVALDYIE